MIEKYKTVYKKSESETIEKKSKFIAHIKPVQTEEEAQKFIESIKKQHYNATHNVFAYRAGIETEVVRYSDDGEPSGTAGMPILNILQGEDIKNTVIVVTRYFGGTLLGTGGLVRAYQGAAKEGLKHSVVIEKELFQKASIEIDYTLTGKMEYELLKNGFIILDTYYTQNVKFDILIKYSKIKNFSELIKELTSDSVKPIFSEKIYASYIDDELIIF